MSAAKSEWLSKADAARLLGVAVRQLERREAQGYIEKRKRPRAPDESTARSEYSRADVLALKAGRPNVHAVPVADPNGAAGGANGANLHRTGADSTAVALRPGSFDLFAGLAAHLARLSAAYPAQAPAPKPWLTLQEAAEASGLPAAHLLRDARAGSIAALNVGSPARAVWRFNRAALGVANGR